ncbi:hypothetical protein [Falsibacillus albus]|uniref:Uncharacterized protein n=1 Tax=Falsibacillus albus TaxID=2478915 RepID=A0A3L7JVQ2_9BACI|nr:hypothetical protein [Falsibacillus albus]RLQ94334.1 hypothetical protein D9X91_14870 [Falsibacillus albus]
MIKNGIVILKCLEGMKLAVILIGLCFILDKSMLNWVLIAGLSIVAIIREFVSGPRVKTVKYYQMHLQQQFWLYPLLLAVLYGVVLIHFSVEKQVMAGVFLLGFAFFEMTYSYLRWKREERKQWNKVF